MREPIAPSPRNATLLMFRLLLAASSCGLGTDASTSSKSLSLGIDSSRRPRWFHQPALESGGFKRREADQQSSARVVPANGRKCTGSGDGRRAQRQSSIKGRWNTPTPSNLRSVPRRLFSCAVASLRERAFASSGDFNRARVPILSSLHVRGLQTNSSPAPAPLLFQRALSATRSNATLQQKMPIRRRAPTLARAPTIPRKVPRLLFDPQIAVTAVMSLRALDLKVTAA